MHPITCKWVASSEMGSFRVDELVCSYNSITHFDCLRWLRLDVTLDPTDATMFKFICLMT